MQDLIKAAKALSDETRDSERLAGARVLRLRGYASLGHIPVPGITQPWHSSGCWFLADEAGRVTDCLFD